MVNTSMKGIQSRSVRTRTNTGRDCDLHLLHRRLLHHNGLSHRLLNNDGLDNKGKGFARTEIQAVEQTQTQTTQTPQTQYQTPHQRAARDRVRVETALATLADQQ